MLIIVGYPSVIEFMIGNTDCKKRNTGLEYRLRNTDINNGFGF